MTTVFLSALSAVLTLFIFVAGGFCFRRFGVIDRDFASKLAAVVFKLFLPMLMLRVVLLQADTESVRGDIRLIAVSLALLALGIPLGAGLSRLFKGRLPTAAARFAVMFPNFIFMGMPVVLAMYGDAAAQALVIYTLPMNLLVSSVGYMIIASSGRFDVKSLLNPCVIALLVGFIWRAAGVPVPGFVAQALELGGGVVSPLAMFQVGVIIAGFNLRSLGGLRTAALFSAIRLVALPLLTAAILRLCGMSGLDVCIPAIIAAMPVAANMTITASAVGRYEDISAQLVFVSTALSLVTIPFIAAAVDFIAR